MGVRSVGSGSVPDPFGLRSESVLINFGPNFSETNNKNSKKNRFVRLSPRRRGLLAAARRAPAAAATAA